MGFPVRLLSLSVLIFLLSLSTQVNAQHARRNKATRNSSPRPPKVRFISGNSSLKIPFELSNNLILLQARVNDSAPLWFILIHVAVQPDHVRGIRAPPARLSILNSPNLCP